MGGGKHGFLLPVLTETKIRLATRNQDLDCGRIKNPELLNPKIEDNNKGREIPHFQKDQKVKWQDYTFQEVVDSVAVKAIAAVVNAQYLEELEEDYVG